MPDLLPALLHFARLPAQHPVGEGMAAGMTARSADAMGLWRKASPAQRLGLWAGFIERGRERLCEWGLTRTGQAALDVTFEASPGLDAFLFAARAGQGALCQRLLGMGANANGFMPATAHPDPQPPQFPALLLSDRSDDPLDWLQDAGCTHFHTAPPNAWGLMDPTQAQVLHENAFLMHSIFRKRPNLLSLLVKSGMNPDVMVDGLPLMAFLADRLMSDHAKPLVCVLLDHGARLEAGPGTGIETTVPGEGWFSDLVFAERARREKHRLGLLPPADLAATPRNFL